MACAAAATLACVAHASCVHQPCVRRGKQAYVPASSAQADGSCFCGVCCSCDFGLNAHASCLHQPCVRSSKQAYEPASSARAGGSCFCGVRCSRDFSQYCSSVPPSQRSACAAAGRPVGQPAQPGS